MVLFSFIIYGTCFFFFFLVVLESVLHLSRWGLVPLGFPLVSSETSFRNLVTALSLLSVFIRLSS